MYSSSNNTNEFEKYSTAPYPPSHHVQFADHHSQFSDQQPFTGIPVSHTDPIRAQPPASWSATLCGCCDDVSNCCITCWCPCITFGQIAEIVDKGSTSCGTSGALYTLINFVTGCAWIYSCFYRSKLRQQYHLKETPCNDCLVHCFCEYCALCQEYRELKTRGFDMSLGWHGNMEKQTQGVTMAPIFRQDMNR